MTNPEIHLYNTLSGKKELFKPIKSGAVGIYNCGPTVYSDAHIGNLRAYVFSDILRRVFEYNDYEVKQVINITDVGHLVTDGDDGEDKMTKALKREGKPLTLEAMKEVATTYFEHFVRDLKLLNIELPEYFPRASENIPEDIEIIKILEKKEIAYKTSDGVYFDTSKFPGYGKLGNISMKHDDEGTRIAQNMEKKNHADFALWKFNKELGWESPWGKGFPGWHIECSAMSRKYLGQPFDIHTGGTDHIPTHHNNEIAQSEAAFDKPLANYWLHGEHLVLNNAKIAKSSGNAINLSSLEENKVSPLAYRYWLLTAHYRSLVNFSLEAVLAAQNAYIRLVEAFISFKSDKAGVIDGNFQDKFKTAINDDLNMPEAIALTWQMIKDHHVSDADKRATLLDFDRVFGLGLSAVEKLDDSPASIESLPPEVFALLEARDEARAAKDWQKSDALRLEIESRGYDVKDTAEGSVLKKK